MLAPARYLALLVVLTTSRAVAQSSTDTLATMDPARQAIALGLQAGRRSLGTFLGPVCVEVRARGGRLLNLPASMVRGAPERPLIRGRNCPSTFATNGGYVDPITGVSDNPVPPPGYVDPMWMILQLGPGAIDSLPFLTVTLRQGTGFSFLECGYSRFDEQPYLCAFRGSGAY